MCIWVYIVGATTRRESVYIPISYVREPQVPPARKTHCKSARVYHACIYGMGYRARDCGFFFICLCNMVWLGDYLMVDFKKKSPIT